MVHNSGEQYKRFSILNGKIGRPNGNLAGIPSTIYPSPHRQNLTLGADLVLLHRSPMPRLHHAIATLTLPFLLALSLAGCGSKEPSGSPATTAAPGAKPAPTGVSTGASPGASPGAKSYPAPTNFDLIPLAVGQWIRLLVKTAGEPPMPTVIKIVGKEGNAFWCEIEQDAPSGKTVLQFLMDESGRNDFKSTSIKRLKIKAGNGAVQELSGAALAASGALTDKFIQLIGKPKVDNAQRADATVAAGEFKGCYLHEYDQKILGISMKIKSWNHPAVPINGFVRSEGTANGKPTTTELVEMHLDGAKSAL
ncbi:MAG: hypothetical protein IPK82_42900 [Polyangiaceae bacterium]|nr:hypothetical protein [Polyangiaceae bacterium]